MRGYFLSGDEIAALFGAPDLAQLLYTLGIRPRMDRNCLVGIKPKVSWWALCEDLETEGVPGIKHQKPSVEAVRRAARQLEKRSLVEFRSEGKQLIFFLPKALMGYSAKNKADRLSDRLSDTKMGAQHIETKEESSGLLMQADTQADGKADTHTTVLYCTEPYNAHARENGADKVPTAEQWQEFFIVEFRYLPPDVLTPACIAMFESWSVRAVPLSTVRKSIEMATARLGRLPDNPSYFRRFVDEYIQLSNSHALSAAPSHLADQRLWLVAGEAYVMAVSQDQAEALYCRESGRALEGVMPQTQPIAMSDTIAVGGRDVLVSESIRLWVEHKGASPAIMCVVGDV